MKKYMLKISLFAAILLCGVAFPIQSTTAQNKPCVEKTTEQFDDDRMCDPEGQGCTVVWSCPPVIPT